MPKLYEYLGIIIFFYSNDHQPVHVHGKYNGRESKAEIMMMNGKVTGIRITHIGPGLESKKLKEFEEFVSKFADDIVRKWVDFFVYRKHITPQIITYKI